ncbi:MAG: hypothetical protein CVV64_17420 [Candidatus Wallbacteria bacterium HGW-Wallbacteria-1]|jgi:ankyrin repeat protein|uniref:Uncharacterized protein n=1 Tax=Candidatus Wallbacteria bacterium HGW-Wallbacteria-1 TaxID=2013854 RepID=A0A2N1PKD9_9BACT|nr:MAG: hypothetical protein CVV64_17420 [Candidatus Wallbacteria bacterium HGW-Wallbacteria-1]
MISLLIENKANVNAKDLDGNIPAHYASKFGNIEILKLLCFSGSDINSLNENGVSPLYFAALYKQFKSVAFLLEQNARTNLRDKMGHSLLYYLFHTPCFEFKCSDFKEEIKYELSKKMTFFEYVYEILGIFFRKKIEVDNEEKISELLRIVTEERTFKEALLLNSIISFFAY